MSKNFTDRIKSFMEKNRQDNKNNITGWNLRVREIYIYFQSLHSNKNT